MHTILVLALIPQLGSDDFQTRTLAHHQLEQLLPIAGPYLLRASSDPNPEIAARAAVLSEKWSWQVAEAIKPTKWPYLPWIDSLPQGYPNRFCVISEYLSMVGCCVGETYGGGGPPHWPKYRCATKFYVQKLLIEGKEVEQVQSLLDSMVTYEKNWIKQHQHGFKFPAEMLSACDE